MLEEPLIFEIGDTDSTGVDFETTVRRRRPERRPAWRARAHRARSAFPGLSEPADRPPLHPPQSRQNYAIDLGLFPLGSCTMKHNPRLNEKMARLPGFADIHPLQPQETVQGALELINVAGLLADRR